MWEWKVRINGDKSKVMRMEANERVMNMGIRIGRVMDMRIRIGRVRVEQVECYKYLGVVISAEGDGRQDGHILIEENRALGGKRDRE